MQPPMEPKQETEYKKRRDLALFISLFKPDYNTAFSVALQRTSVKDSFVAVNK